MLIHVFAVGLLLAATGGRLDMRQYRNNRSSGNNPLQKEQVTLQKQALALQEASNVNEIMIVIDGKHKRKIVIKC